jgi:glycosyltransferase involved in cell wall biosynthesis
MKIAITTEPENPVPPLMYGGKERIVDMLVKGLTQKGHEVTLFAHKDSVVPCKLKKYSGKNSTKTFDVVRNTLSISRLLYSRFDVVHSFGRLTYLAALLPTRLPKIMTYQREPSLPQVAKAFKLARKNSLVFTGCSEYIASQIRPIAPAYTIFNGIPLEPYTYREEVSKDAPLVYLGRIEYTKGTHIAIEAARKSGKNLVIAGNVPPEAEHQDYFNTLIKPQLDDKQITYVGSVSDEQKNELLGSASAFLMPSLINEPFGLVMAEAMACGTPVIGFHRGSVPEVVRSGINGFVCKDKTELIKHISQIDQISRRVCREIVDLEFSDVAIIDQYEALYHQMITKELFY